MSKDSPYDFEFYNMILGSSEFFELKGTHLRSGVLGVNSVVLEGGSLIYMENNIGYLFTGKLLGAVIEEDDIFYITRKVPVFYA